jgi:hypothetical protein
MLNQYVIIAKGAAEAPLEAVPWPSPAGRGSDAERTIGQFIDAYNDRCQPFSWTKDTDQLLANARPAKA